MTNPNSPDSTAPQVSFWQAFAFWLKLGFISFGGPAGQISIMHQELVERRRWISERRFRGYTGMKQKLGLSHHNHMFYRMN